MFDLKEVDWGDCTVSPQQKTMWLSSQLLCLARKHDMTVAEQNLFHDYLQQLYQLRTQAPHDVNQALRALMNLMVESHYRTFVIAEVMFLVNNVANSVLAKVINKDNPASIDPSFGTTEDILMEAWTKTVAKYRQSDELQQFLQQGNDLKDISAKDFKGIFNPLIGDFLSWFTQVATNKARDYIKMSARKRARENNYVQKKGLKNE